MLQTLRTAVEIIYGLQDIWVGLPYVVATVGVLVGGSIIWVFFIWLLQCMFVKKERAEDLVAFDVDASGDRLKERKIFEKKPSRCCGNFVHLLLQTLLFSGLAMILWIAFASAGFNVWTSAAASLGISLVGTYGFMTPLSLLLNGYTATAARSVVVGEHVEFHGMGEEWSGRVIAIHNMSVDIVRYDDKTKSDEIISMPISRFLDQPRKRNFKHEHLLESMYGHKPRRLIQIDYAAKRPIPSSSRTGRTVATASKLSGFNKYAEECAGFYQHYCNSARLHNASLLYGLSNQSCRYSR